MFEGRNLILGQLIYVRKDTLNHSKFDANAVPALFAGWRFDHGPRSRKGVYFALDHLAIKERSAGYAVAMRVLFEEVYVPPGEPVLPLNAAAEAALADFSDPKLADYLPKEVPFSSLPVDAPAVTRHQYITLGRIIRFGATPDCKGCEEMKGRHNQRCKIRFDSFLKAEKAARHEKGPEIPETGARARNLLRVNFLRKKIYLQKMLCHLEKQLRVKTIQTNCHLALEFLRLWLVRHCNWMKCSSKLPRCVPDSVG